MNRKKTADVAAFLASIKRTRGVTTGLTWLPDTGWRVAQMTDEGIALVLSPGQARKLADKFIANAGRTIIPDIVANLEEAIEECRKLARSGVVPDARGGFVPLGSA